MLLVYTYCYLRVYARTIPFCSLAKQEIFCQEVHANWSNWDYTYSPISAFECAFCENNRYISVNCHWNSPSCWLCSRKSGVERVFQVLNLDNNIWYFHVIFVNFSIQGEISNCFITQWTTKSMLSSGVGVIKAQFLNCSLMKFVNYL